MEELLLQTSTGSLVTRGPGNYKIPGSHDIPQQFNVKILKNKTYKTLKTINSSKAIGEPPLFLASAVFFALRDAVVYARKSNGIKEPLLNFSSPATPESLRLACRDYIVDLSNVEPKLNETTNQYEKLFFTRH
jgi:xanthine dehydrogenase/oxidase